MTTPADTVTVYTNPGCGPCIGTKAKLRRLGVKFAEIDLSQDEQALAVLKARAAEQNKTLPAEKAIVISQAPVVTYGDTIWHSGPIIPARLEALAAKVKSNRPAETAGMVNHVKARGPEDIRFIREEGQHRVEIRTCGPVAFDLQAFAGKSLKVITRPDLKGYWIIPVVKSATYNENDSVIVIFLDLDKDGNFLYRAISEAKDGAHGMAADNTVKVTYEVTA